MDAVVSFSSSGFLFVIDEYGFSVDGPGHNFA